MESKSKDSKTITVPVRPAPPDLRTVTPLKAVMGDNPRVMNLKDHAELDGVQIIITAARVSNGEMGAYVVMRCYTVPKDGGQPTAENAVTLMTGSENIVERIGPLCGGEDFPVSGTLRKAGRAWLLD